MANQQLHTINLSKWLWMVVSGLLFFVSMLAFVPGSTFVHATSTVSIAAEEFNGTRHALLISASKYPSLPKHFQLKGPEHDAELVWATLADNGFKQENITVLADNIEVEGAKSPTLAAITGALDELAKDVKAGDFVYVHFAGHGSQQPARTKDGADAEADGLDEIFLPSDIGKWNDGTSKVDNALEDNVVGEKLGAIRDKGAFVWVVFDSCHSGTMTRDIKVDVQERRIDPLVLGVPEGELNEVKGDALRTRGNPVLESPLDNITTQGDNKRGGLVAFYAAQTTETTPEMRLPRGEPGRQSHGLFTFTLMSVVAQYPGITYQQAYEEILNRYQAKTSAPTPLAEGTDMNAPIFGTEEASAVTQWKLTSQSDVLKVNAGSIHSVTTDSILAVVPGPTAKDEDVIGYVAVSSAGTMRSEVEPIAYKEKKPLAPESIPDGAYVRMDTPAISMKLNVALPSSQSKKFKAAIDVIKVDQDLGLLINWLAEGSDADLHLYEFNGRIYMLPPSAEFDKENPEKTTSIGLEHPELIATLLDNLHSVAKVSNLMRLTTYMGSAVDEERVEMTISVIRKKTGKKDVIRADQFPELLHGDKVTLEIKNNKKEAVDVTVLFVGSNYAVVPVYPYKSYHINRIEAGKSLMIKQRRKNYSFEIDANESTGSERLILIAVEAEEKTKPSNFSFLAQPALKTRGAGTKDATSSLHGLLRQAGFGATNTRGIGMEEESNLEHGSMDVYGWTTSQ